jgi:magnesium chelatase subunit H
VLAELDVPYIAAHARSSSRPWSSGRRSERGLMPVEATMMVAIPELDGSTGRWSSAGAPPRRARPQPRHAAPTRSAPRPWPPGSSGWSRCARRRRPSARSPSCCSTSRRTPATPAPPPIWRCSQSLFNTLKACAARATTSTCPIDVDALRERIVNGNAAPYGAHANVFTRIPADDHVRREPHLAEIEAQWGPAPGKQQTDGRRSSCSASSSATSSSACSRLRLRGRPDALLFDKGFTPTHAFSAFYRFLREDFGAHAVLHFGTHGALEFMPGKQAGMSGACWPTG